MASDQKRTSLRPSATLIDALTGGATIVTKRRASPRHRLYERLSLRPEQARTPIEKLSGGERGRLTLAIALAAPSNLIVSTSRPTTSTSRRWICCRNCSPISKGTILLVSHDRDFLDRVATSRDRQRGRRALARIFRRLFRHGRAARLRAVRSARIPDGEARQAGGPPEEPAGGEAKTGFNERRALERLPERMDALRQELDALEIETRRPRFRRAGACGVRRNRRRRSPCPIPAQAIVRV